MKLPENKHITKCFSTREIAEKMNDGEYSAEMLLQHLAIHWNRVEAWGELSDSGLRLRCGELTSQEIRTVRAVLNAILANAEGETRPRPNNMETSPADFALEQEPVPASVTSKGVGCNAFFGLSDAAKQAVGWLYSEQARNLSVMEARAAILEGFGVAVGRELRSIFSKMDEEGPLPRTVLAQLRRDHLS